MITASARGCPRGAFSGSAACAAGRRDQRVRRQRRRRRARAEALLRPFVLGSAARHRQRRQPSDRSGCRDRPGASPAPDATFRRAGSRTRARSSTRSRSAQGGAGGARRRSLDVGQARLLMWDGQRDALYNQVVRPARDRRRDEQLAPLHGRADLPEVPTGLRGGLRRRCRLSPTRRQFPALSATLTGCQPMNPTDPQPTCDGTFHGAPGDHAEYDGMTADQPDAPSRASWSTPARPSAPSSDCSRAARAPFDAWMHGGAPISRAAQRGAAVFVGNGDCVRLPLGAVHVATRNFTTWASLPRSSSRPSSTPTTKARPPASRRRSPIRSTRSAPFSDGNDGRLPAAVTPAMTAPFRTPILRCVSLRPTFMHTGQIGTLAGGRRLLQRRGGDPRDIPATSEIHALGLTALEQSDLVAFLEALAGPGADPTLQHAP